LEAAELEELEAHLAECPDCGPLAQVERQMDSRLAQAMKAVPVPADLRGRVLGRLQSERDIQVRKRRRWIGVPAAAAILLIALGLGWKLFQKPSTIDVEGTSDGLFGLSLNPRPQVLEDFFQAEGIRTVAPADANYSLLRDLGVASFQGKQVPKLLFTDGKSNTYVYILPAREFDVAAAMRNPVISGSGWKAEMRQDPSGNYGYLVIYIGEEPLKVFPDRNPPSEL
jgi:hypothetical protein